MTLETQLEASRANAGAIEALRALLGERLTRCGGAPGSMFPEKSDEPVMKRSNTKS